MPYIAAEHRAVFDQYINTTLAGLAELPEGRRQGALNYIITRIVAGGIDSGDRPWSYNKIAEAIGTFECAKLEFYRRVAAPKEDQVMTLNGDIIEYAPEA